MSTPIYYITAKLTLTGKNIFPKIIAINYFVGTNTRAGAYRFDFYGQEKDDEVAGVGNIMTAEFWEYDARLGRRWNLDPVYKHHLSNYSVMSGNFISRIDPKGADDEWVEKNGQMLYDNRVTDQGDVTALYGKGAIYRPNGYSYKSSDGSNIELVDYGFFKSNGQIFSSPDLAQNSLAYTNPTQVMSNAQSSISAIKASYAIPLAIRSGQAVDAVTPDPTDILPWKWFGHGVLFLGTAYYIAKMDQEIEGIMRRAGGPQGYLYSLTANTSVTYPWLTWGNKANSTTQLAKDAVWKFGETSSKSDRYSTLELKSIG